MFVQSHSTTRQDHKNGLCVAQRRGGKETLVQWQNGDQRWCDTSDLDGHVVLVSANYGEGETSYE
ncbi:MAG: hypothetical protein CBD16_08095 [Betaproteobacteria bacterium TMED156]|nr:MAG: hypothetical protein CBD16_08095 [Betaproteobacteria bacterium TMED156]|tara:strand:- start:66 stop:260 length:195 start_codon:yes stop_codon:yes gene_type:complete